ncbi:BTB/POZ domain-containing protein 16 [Lissotriton helveticus]
MSSKMATGNTSMRLSGLEPDPEFFPTPPPKAPRSVTLNARDVLRTPYVALTGGLSPEEEAATRLHSHKVPFGSRQRIIRCQVGLSNRWQLPCNLDFDLLGSAQARKAIRTGFNETLKRIMTEDTGVSRSEDAKSDALSLPPAVPPLSASHTTRADYKDTRPSLCLFKSGQKVMAPDPAFVYHAQKVEEGLEPDVALQCLGTTWELHRPYLIKSGTLSHLLRLALEQQKQAEAALDLTEKKVTGRTNMLYPSAFKQSHSESSLRKMAGEKVTISLDVKDELVTKVAFSLALRNLYFSEIEVNQEMVVGLLASASVLQFQSLFQKCVITMKNSVSSANVGKFYYAGHKFRQDALVNICEQWLELNLVPNLGSQIYLRQLPQELLQKTLKSPRLYTFNEYRLFRTVLYWVFLQQNPNIQMLPAHNTILSYFNSLPKRGAFLETQVGQKYMPVFKSLRLHGITQSQHLEELCQINVLPQDWLVRVLSNHHHALQNGGDMPLQTDFITQAVRFGLMVNDEDRQYFGEIISRYGFYFQLKAVQHEASIYSFYMQRVKPSNPALSFHTSERSSFSLRQDREVEYKITTQSVIEGKWKEFSLGPLTHKFGMTNRNHKSKILKACLPNHPIYVTFALLFPSS